MALDATYVYWTSPGVGSASIVKAAINGGEVTTIASNLDGAAGIAVDNTSPTTTASNVYWTDSSSGTVMRQSLTISGNGTPIATGQQSPAGIAVDSSGVYWVNQAPGGADNNGTVMRLTGGIATTLAFGQLQPTGLVLDDPWVYWVDLGTNGSDGNVARAQMNGGLVTTLATGYNVGTAPVRDSTSLYWAICGAGYDGDGRLLRVPLDGGAVATLVGQAGNVTGTCGIAINSSKLYFTEVWATMSATQNNGSVLSIPVDGGTPTLLLGPPHSPQDDPNAVVADDANLYWANNMGGGSVMELVGKGQ